ncbi:Dhx29 [Symbiodinium necroappetens]|uniref:Dhx29 protein n=1 Tax=Symbiodinium necroappetens TaxID=1628268 RepID=A0A812LME3_9DINO|nr:Dhx29 [Symbiodinium necroappetens]
MEVQKSILKAPAVDRLQRSRRVILTTDVAESSVTIRDVDVVIDLCEHKRPRWNALSKQSFLTTSNISKDEATQRAGRTGRLREGTVIRVLTKSVYEGLKQHVDPGIKHARLEDVILTIFEHWKVLGTPEQFLNKLPDPPETEQVRAATRRLLELRGIEKDRSGMPKLTEFGRLLQRMPVDPEVGILVMSGVHFGVVHECCVMASIIQRGLPFLENPNWTLKESQRFVAVRDACLQDLPADAGQACNMYPSDLIAGLQAYRAWQQQQLQHPDWSLHGEWSWCLGHFFSLQRLHEIEETVIQLRSVLQQLKLAREVPAEIVGRVRERCKQMLTPDLEPPEPCWAEAPDCDVKALLGVCTPDPKKQWLLRWCIASAFTSGALEVTGGGCSEAMQVRFVPGSSQVTPASLLRYLQEHSDLVTSVTSGKKGECYAQFRHGAPARQLVQALDFANEVPWKHAMLWQRGKFSHPTWQARQCYMKHSKEFKIIPTSAASPLLLNRCTVVSAQILPVASPDGKVLCSCSFCSVMPPGVVPAVLEAVYPAVRKFSDGDQLELLCAGHREMLPTLAAALRGLDADPAIVPDLTTKLRSIRASIGKEMGEDDRNVQRIVKKRADEAISIMESLAALEPSNSVGLREMLPSLETCNLAAFSLVPF